MPREDTAKGEYVLVQAAVPGARIEDIGVLLIDSESNQLHSRFRRDIQAFAGDEWEWFENLGEDVSKNAERLGGRECLDWMEATLSHILRISERVTVLVDNYHQTAERLYLRYIRPKVLPFRTHLPRYSLQAAAGRFGRQMPVDPEGWTEVWPHVPLTEDMFVSHIKGHSMEPAIPDGSLGVFKGNIVGSSNGKIVLVEQYGEPGGNRYTVKRYRISKNPDSHDEGKHPCLNERITLESINPAYKSWDVSPTAKVRILGEFLFVV
jgi:SOS-response transcriptional repressor LexA